MTSAAYLCRYGYRTLLCEKSDRIGGLVGTFNRQGFAFDSGIRAFENSGILFPMLKILGIDIDFTKNPVSIGIENQWTRLDSRSSLRNYGEMLAAVFPENITEINLITEEIKKVMEYMDVLYAIDNPLFLDNMRDGDYFVKTLLPWLLKYEVNIRKASRLNEPVCTYLQRFTDNRALIDMIAQHFFKDTPTFFALSYFGLYLDYCYPKGGTGVLAQKVADYIRSSGGEILTRAEAIDVDVSNNQIKTADGQIFRYKKLIWAADQKALYASIGEIHSSDTKNKRLLAERCSGGDSILTVFMGVNLTGEYFEGRCGAHAFYTPGAKGLSSLSGWEEAAVHGEERLYEWIEKYLERTTYEISCPALRDASLAPEGKTGVIVSTLMDYQLVRYLSDNGNYDVFKEFCMKKITEELDASCFPGIRENIEFMMCSTPLTIERETGNAQGAITGWAFTNTVMPAENRFKKIKNAINTPIKDVFQCGQWTFSPSGLPVSILTGKLAADAVRKTLKGTKTDSEPKMMKGIKNDNDIR